eukprot:485254-Pleurochrysis_carterae.AAC.1
MQCIQNLHRSSDKVARCCADLDKVAQGCPACRCDICTCPEGAPSSCLLEATAGAITRSHTCRRTETANRPCPRTLSGGALQRVAQLSCPSHVERLWP